MDDPISLREAVEGAAAKDAPRSGQCFFCRQYATRLEYDHFPIPYHFGGELVVPACLTCHDLKDRRDILDWPPGALHKAFEGLTPFAALLLGKCLKLGLVATAANDPDYQFREPRKKPKAAA